MFEASGRDDAREGPCAASDSIRASTCMTLRYARAYKRLAYSAHLARATVAKGGTGAFARRFNQGDFAHEVGTFCERRERGKGSANGPGWRSLACQSKRLEAKLVEFNTWHDCRRNAMALCSLPNRQFDKSADARP